MLGRLDPARIEEEELVLEPRRLEELEDRANRERPVGMLVVEVGGRYRALLSVRVRRREPVAREVEEEPLAASVAPLDDVVDRAHDVVLASGASSPLMRRARPPRARPSRTFTCSFADTAAGVADQPVVEGHRVADRSGEARNVAAVLVDADHDPPIHGRLLVEDGDDVGHGIHGARPEHGHAIRALAERPELGLVPPIVASNERLPRSLLAGLDIDRDGDKAIGGISLRQRTDEHGLAGGLEIIDVERYVDRRNRASEARPVDDAAGERCR